MTTPTRNDAQAQCSEPPQCIGAAAKEAKP